MARLFPFVQLEFAQGLGPPPGTYMIGEGAPRAAEHDDAREAGPALLAALGSADMLAIRVLGAPAPRKLIRRGPRRIRGDEPEPRELAVNLATIIRATEMLRNRAEGDAFIRRLQDDDAEVENWIDDGLALLNHAIAAYRACSADPYLLEVSRLEPRAIRIGFGDGEQVFAGKWAEAIAIAPPPQPKVSRGVRLLPVQGLAEVLAGRASILESEELLLRVLIDLEHGRSRAAAFGLQAACTLLDAELGEAVLEGSAMRQFDKLADLVGPLDGLVAKARKSALADAEVETLRTISEAAGVLIDKWRYESVAPEHSASSR